MNANNLLNILLARFPEKTTPGASVVCAEGEGDLLKSKNLLDGEYFFMSDGQSYMPTFEEGVVSAWCEDSILFLDWTYILLIGRDGLVSKVVVSSVDGDWRNLTVALELLDPAKEVALWDARSYKLAYKVTIDSLDRYS